MTRIRIPASLKVAGTRIRIPASLKVAGTRIRIPASLKVTVPLLLLAFAATLSAVNVLHYVPQAERAAEEDGRKRLAQEMSRLQSTLEYQLLKGDMESAQHEIAVLAHNHDYEVAALTDDRQVVIAATRRAWLGRPIAEVSSEFDPAESARAVWEHRANIRRDAAGNALLAYAGVLMGREPQELRPSKSGNLFLAYDLGRRRREARAQLLQQSLYWAGWVAVLALALWLVFHFLLTRRTARVVAAAEQLAAGDLTARSRLRGSDELGRLSRAFDSMALRIEETQKRLQGDIAERKRAEEALRLSEASYRAIFDAAEDAIFVHDIETGAIVDVNPKACATFGYTREEFRTIDVGVLGSGESPYTQRDALDLIRRAAEGEQLRIEWHGRSKDGTLRWHEVFIKRATLAGRDRILALARDITEKKRSADEVVRQREALYQREKLAALGSLLAGVAHELNNPLSVVVARAVLLEEQGDLATRTAALKVRTAAERCARIVRTFLAMARQQQAQRGPVAVNEVVAAVLDMTAYALRTSSIEVQLDLAPDLPPIAADGDQLHQVLLNLIINAQQALQDHPAPRRIRVTSRHSRASNSVRIRVEDNGPGIPEAIRSRIFEPYFTTKQTGSGLGVGLAVSAGIVDAHGGTLTAESPDGAGAAFAIDLPVGVVESGDDDTAVPAHSGAGHRVLVIDDEAEIREALVDILRTGDHRVTSAASGREALQRLASQEFDVILADIRMADLDGRALYQEIERRWPDRARRVVFITGDTLGSTLRGFAAESGRPVIEKPFLPADVRRVVMELAAEGGAAAG